MKKLVTVVFSIVLLALIYSVNALAYEGDVILTCGTASSGENWDFDGSKLTLNGANIQGNIIFSCGKTGRTISVETQADSSVSGQIYTSFDDFNCPVNYIFTSKNNAQFTLGDTISGGSNPNETLKIDGCKVTVGGVNFGGSGGMGSNLSLDNGAILCLSTSLYVENIALANASVLKIDASEDYSDCAVTVWGNNSLSIGDGCSVYLKGKIYSIITENSTDNFTDWFPFYPEGCTIGDYSGSRTILDKNGNPITEIILGADAVRTITESKPVKVKTSNTQTTPDIYSVDVEWGKMEFTYKVSGSENWNVKNHSYTDNTSASWEVNGNTVTVTNHSNKNVTASFGFTKASSITENITGSFDVASKQLNAGIVDGYETADKVTSTFTISGALDAAKTAFTKVGSVIVTIQ